MPKKKAISISEAESTVMRVFWTKGDLPSEGVLAALRNQEKWQEPTVKTLLNRLLKKGALRARKDNRRYIYSPVLTQDEWLSSESHGFLDRLFGGRLGPLVSHFSQQQKLSKRDIGDLKRLIKELDDGD